MFSNHIDTGIRLALEQWIFSYKGTKRFPVQKIHSYEETCFCIGWVQSPDLQLPRHWLFSSSILQVHSVPRIDKYVSYTIHCPENGLGKQIMQKRKKGGKILAKHNIIFLWKINYFIGLIVQKDFDCFFSLQIKQQEFNFDFYSFGGDRIQEINGVHRGCFTKTRLQ